MKKPFFHVTAVANVDGILQEGLKGGTTPRNRGELCKVPSIFVLTSASGKLTDNVAINQIWPSEDIKEYAVVKLRSAGVTGPILPDHVGEDTAAWHRVIQQVLIEPSFLSLEKVKKLDFPGAALDTITNKAMFRRKLSKTEWLLLRRWCRSLVRPQEEFEAKLAASEK